MMKCRLFSALLLLFTLMAAGCSGQPAAGTADDNPLHDSLHAQNRVNLVKTGERELRILHTD